MNPNLVVSIKGEPKSGKTHLALSFPEPILLYSFDLGAEIVREKPVYKDKQIEIRNWLPPIAESLVPEPYAEEFWKKLKKDYKKAVEGGKFKTIILDPATVTWEVVRHAWTEESERRRLLSRDYGEPNARMTWLIMSPVITGMNVVVTNYLKDKYVDDKPTGEEILDGFKRTESLADIALDVEMKPSGVKNKNTTVSTIVRNRFDRDLNGQKFEDLTYKALIALIMGG